jgi:hypothetical protein
LKIRVKILGFRWRTRMSALIILDESLATG